MLKRAVLAFLLTAFAAVAVSAQMADQASIQATSRSQALGVQPAVNPFSLLDLSRIKWSHSYSISYLSGGGASGTAGLWNTSMLYEFSSKLTLRLDLGVSHGGGSLYAGDVNSASFLPGFVLDYHPSESFRMTIGMQTFNGYPSFSPYSPFGWSAYRGGYGYWPY